MFKLSGASCSFSSPLRILFYVEVLSTCPKGDGSTLCSWARVSLAAELTGCLGLALALMGVLRITFNSSNDFSEKVMYHRRSLQSDWHIL